MEILFLLLLSLRKKEEEKNRKIMKITRKNRRNGVQIFVPIARFQIRQPSLKNPCESIFLTVIAHIAGNGTLLQTNLLSGL